MGLTDLGEEKLAYLVSVMAAISLAIIVFATGILYFVSFEQTRERLVETVKSQARLIEAIVDFDVKYSSRGDPEGAFESTLSQIVKAHNSYKGFGKTGEFTLARLEGDQIIFLLSHRHYDMDKPKPVPLDSKTAEPMRRALKGESGSLSGLDYRGEMVLAAFEPVKWTDQPIGIVAKIDLSEIRSPFVKAGLLTLLLAIVVIGFGVFIIIRITTSPSGMDPGVSYEDKPEKEYWPIIASIFLAGCIFLLDISSKLGIAGGVPYVALFLISLRSPTRYMIISMGILGTLLTIIGFFFSPSGAEMWVVLVNRFFAIFAIWIAALLTLYNKETEIVALDNARKLEEAQRIAHIGSWNWDIRTNKINWSGEVYRIFGTDPEKFDPSYDSLFDLVHPDDRGFVTAAVDGAVKGGADYDMEYRIIKQDDKAERIVHSKGIVHRSESGEPLSMTGSVHDVTERKLAEKELETYRNHLEEQVEKRTAELVAAREKAEAASKAKSTFLSSMSHEIRTPLNSVIGFSGILANDTVNPPTGRQKELLERIINGGERLVELVDDVLDLSRIESGEITVSIEDVELWPAVINAMTEVKPMADESQSTITLQKPQDGLYVKADRIYLKQVLVNLFSNAIKYNKPGGEVIVSSETLDGDKVRLSISDTGIGIPEDKMDNLFKPFDRLGKEGTNIKGAGIGLTIVKRLVESMGAQISVESEMEKGTTVFVIFAMGERPNQGLKKTS